MGDAFDSIQPDNRTAQGAQDAFDQVAQQDVPGALPVRTISATPQPTTWVGKFGQWAEDVSQDLKDGGDRTGIGTVMQKLGARGLHNGNSEAVGDFMASLPLGVLQATKGTTEMTPQILGGPKGKTLQGLGDVVKGGLKAISEPAAFVAPEESALGDESMLGSATNAGKEAASAIGNKVSTVGSAVANKVSTVASGTKALLSDIPAKTESNLVDAVGDAAENAGFERGNSDTLKDAVADLAGKFKGRAQGVYKQLDSEAPGFQELRDKIGQLTQAFKTQQNLDPEKASEIKSILDTAQSSMDSLLDEGQKARWKLADQDWTRFKALQRVQGKANAAASDLTSPELQDVGKLQSGVRSLTNTTRKGEPLDLLARAFGEDAGKIRQVIQEGANMTSNSQAAKQFLKWAAIGIPLIGGVSEGLAHLGGK